MKVKTSQLVYDKPLMGGGGVTDHGALTGLADDDHTIYALRSIMTEQGDIVYRNGAGVWAALAHGNAGQILATGGHGANPAWADAGAGTDIKAKVSADDTTAGYLNGKLTAGAGITLTEGTPGGNETLAIACTVTDTDKKVSVSADDTTAGYLDGKLSVAVPGGLSFYTNSPGGDEQFGIKVRWTAEGDMHYGGAPMGVSTEILAIGAESSILTVYSGIPYWTTATYPATVAIGSVLVANAANVVTALTNAADLKVLQANAAVLSWASTTGTGNVVYATSPTIVTPTIASFVNATHTHQAAASGGQLDHGLALTGLLDNDHTQYTLKATLTEQGDLYYASAASTPAALAHGVAGQILKTGGHAANPSWTDDVVSITFIIDGGGSAISTGLKGFLEIPFACTLTAWTLMADVAGAIVIDVWKDSYANFPPVNADAMPGAGKEPTIAATNQKAQDTTITDWTSYTIAAGDILAFNVDSCTTITKVTLALKATKT